MRILILGISGMLGHAVWLNLRKKHKTFGCIRGDYNELSAKCSLFDKNGTKLRWGNIGIFLATLWAMFILFLYYKELFVHLFKKLYGFLL